MSLGRKIEFKEEEDTSRIKSLGHALQKGLIKGARELSPLPNFGPIPNKLANRLIDQFLPTQEKTPEKIIERTGRILPSTIGSKGLGAALTRSAIGGVLGQAAEEMGGGEGLQAAGEIAAFSLPSLGRKLIPKKSQEKLVDLARRSGMKEKQIAPLLPSQAKQSFFGKIASKGSKTQEALFSTKQGIGQTYDFVKNYPHASQSLSPQNAQKFISDSTSIAHQMPFEVRNQIAQDAKDLINHGFTGKNLINFYQDISSRYKVGREHLERLKTPILEALESISPQLSEDFKLTNELYKKGLKIRKTLKPGISSELMDLGELGKLAHDVVNLSVKGLSQLLGIAGARRFAREMLINPRLQNIGKQISKAANEGKFSQVLQLAEYIKKNYEDQESVEEEYEDTAQYTG